MYIRKNISFVIRDWLISARLGRLVSARLGSVISIQDHDLAELGHAEMVEVALQDWESDSQVRWRRRRGGAVGCGGVRWCAVVCSGACGA